MIGMDDDFTGTVTRARFEADVHADGPAELGVMGVGDWTMSDGTTFPLRASGTGIGEEVLTPPTRAFVPTATPDRLEAEVTIDGMGHTVPRAVVPPLAAALLGHIETVDRR